MVVQIMYMRVIYNNWIYYSLSFLLFLYFVVFLTKTITTVLLGIESANVCQYTILYIYMYCTCKLVINTKVDATGDHFHRNTAPEAMKWPPIPSVEQIERILLAHIFLKMLRTFKGLKLLITKLF